MSNSNEGRPYQKRTSSQKPPKGWIYDASKLKEIPIQSVCTLLNIPVERTHGHRAMCRVRQEHTPSTVLYLDTNTFHDFGGGGTGGDVIAFYAYAAGVSQGDAMKALGEAFDIAPANPRAGLQANELSPNDWKRIGIQSDRATKNFIFNVDRIAPERLWELSEQYNMPMNELRKKHPHTYERILLQTALPYVRALRNSYYLNVYGLYHFYDSLGHPELFQVPANQQDLMQEKERLLLAERTLSRAVHGTSITFHQDKSYEPNAVLRPLLRGEPELGTRSYKSMQASARKHKCYIRYRTLALSEYQDNDFSALPHTAFVKGDRVSVGFLPKDEEKVQTLMNNIKQNRSCMLPEESQSLSEPTVHVSHDVKRER